MRTKYDSAMKRIKREWHPIFFLFLGIAFVLWYLNELNHTHTSTVNILVKVEENPGGAVSILRGEHEVELRMQGKGYKLLGYKLFPGNNTVVIDAEKVEIRPSSNSDSLSEVTMSSLFGALDEVISDMKLLSIVTPRFEISSSPLKSRRVPVMSRVMMTTKQGYAQSGKMELFPATIMVKSVDPILDTLSGIYTDRVYFRDVNGSLAGVVQLTEIPGVIFSVSEVGYSVTVEMIDKKEDGI